jgi:hypothetical protein
MSDWVSVKVRLPNTDRQVLVWDDNKKKIIFLAYKTIDKDRGYWGWGGYFPGRQGLTHWMDLPDPPETD